MKPLWKQQPLEDRLRMIREAWGDGVDVSQSILASRIEEMFGYTVTRNTIAGAYSRNKELRVTNPLSGDMNAGRERKPPKPRKQSPRKTPALATKEAKPRKARKSKAEINQLHRDYDENSLRIGIEELTTRSCKFIVTDDVPFFYCGHPVEVGKSWCDHHHRRVFVCKPVKDEDT